MAALLAPCAAAAKRPRHRLRGFASCASLVAYARHHLAATKGVPGRTVAPLAEPTPASLPQNGQAPAPTAATPATDAGGAGTDYSTTNDQEAGVDEPDAAKTNGDTLFTVAGDTVYAISVRGESRMLGSLKLDGYGGQLLLRGNRLVAIVQKGFLYPGPVVLARQTSSLVPMPYPGIAKTELTEIDVSDPSAMKVSRTLTFDGTLAGARMNGGTIRVVLNSAPQAYASPAAARTVRGWLPRSRLVSNVSGRRRTRLFVPCNRISRPPSFSGLGLLSIVTLNLDKGLWQQDSDGVMADAQTVYGSTQHLYVATQRWIDPSTPAADLPPGTTTLISRFDVSDPDRTTYEGSGSVPGYLLNQYSLSEQGADLRVATTTEPTWWNGAQQQPSESLVTVLRGASLSRIGQVRGLGHGQRVYSVRFAGDVGYVVTFRQVDPLYVIDLSDPTSPRVRGELELLGYSAYLHPVGDGRLLGVGQDATPEGRLQGAQVSLFDVSNPAAPRLLDHRSLGDQSSSQVQYDPHAFLYWAPKRLAFLPLELWGGGGTPFAGAVALRVTGTLSEAGRIQHDPVGGYLPAIQRAVVVGGRVYTISDAGVMGTDLGTFGRLSFVAFPQQPTGVPVEPKPGSPQPAASAAR